MSDLVRVPVLMLHKIAPAPKGTRVPGHYVPAPLFASQMRAMKLLGYRTVSLDRLFLEDLPRKPLVVTFDDGYENFVTNALPILAQVGFGATVFLVANQIGGTNVWDHEAGDVLERLLTAGQIHRCRDAGIEFGSHTLDHADLVDVGGDEAWRQIEGSKRLLEEVVGSPIRTFCYPYGHKTPEIEAMVKAAGYRLACSVSGGYNTIETNRYSLNRINLRSDTTVPILLYKLLRDRKRG